MVPIVTPAEMRAIDAAAPVDVSVLIDRAGAAVARTALRMMGGAYGRTVHVIAGGGNNGADGRAAAARLADRGVRVRLHSVASCPARLDPADLVIDAAFGTGIRDAWEPPDVGDTPVLAVDIPSGIDGASGAAYGRVLAARRTVTFAALKPGLLFGAGAQAAGEVEVADIGLDCSGASAWLVEAIDVAGWMVPRPVDAHKWRSAVRVVAGSAGMTGAARLTVAAAQRAGAGIVHASVPGVAADLPLEAVQVDLADSGWASDVADSLERFDALVVGPGLGRQSSTQASVRHLVSTCTVPTVIDGDGLYAIAHHPDGAIAALIGRRGPTVLTPHDGEFALLAGGPPGADRLTAARRLAFDSECVVLLKGPSTVVADPSGATLVVRAGDQRLATAGSGDVLSGVIGALLASGMPALHAAAAGAWLHGRAALHGARHGLIASDVVGLLPQAMDEVMR